MRSKKWLNTIWVAQAANDAVSPGASRKTGSAVHGGFSVPPSSLLVRNSTTMSCSKANDWQMPDRLSNQVRRHVLQGSVDFSEATLTQFIFFNKRSAPLLSIDMADDSDDEILCMKRPGTREGPVAHEFLYSRITYQRLGTAVLFDSQKRDACPFNLNRHCTCSPPLPSPKPLKSQFDCYSGWVAAAGLQSSLLTTEGYHLSPKAIQILRHALSHSTQLSYPPSRNCPSYPGGTHPRHSSPYSRHTWLTPHDGPDGDASPPKTKLGVEKETMYIAGGLAAIGAIWYYYATVEHARIEKKRERLDPSAANAEGRPVEDATRAAKGRAQEALKNVH
ncbi:hypothetical protein BJV77DRAFT_962068 [Russula vinacea]|nr:hypothetical protein BJV77DRAFT_962068 [Russula vinacea]